MISFIKSSIINNHATYLSKDNQTFENQINTLFESIALLNSRNELLIKNIKTFKKLTTNFGNYWRVWIELKGFSGKSGLKIDQQQVNLNLRAFWKEFNKIEWAFYESENQESLKECFKGFLEQKEIATELQHKFYRQN